MRTFPIVTKTRLAQGLQTAILSAMVVLAMACSSSERRVDDVVVYPTPSENPSDEIQKLKAEVDDARTRNVDLLAPTWFASAERSLQASKKIQDDGGDYRQLFKRVAEGRMQVQRANEIAVTSEKIVRDVLKARNEARVSQQEANKAGATDLDKIKGAMRDADQKFMNITKSIENNDLENMLDRKQDTIRAYAAVQSLAMQKGKLDTAKRVVGEAVRQGAKKFAPKSLNYAEEVINSTEELIKTNPGAEADIARKSEEALFFARRALLFTQEARDISKRNPEDTVLWMEQSISAVAEEAGSADMRDEKLDNQVTYLKNRVADLRTTSAANAAQAQAAEKRAAAYPPTAKKAHKRTAARSGSTVVTPRPGDRVTVTVEPSKRAGLPKESKPGAHEERM